MLAWQKHFQRCKHFKVLIGNMHAQVKAKGLFLHTTDNILLLHTM